MALDWVCEKAIREFLVRGIRDGSLTLRFEHRDDWVFGQKPNKAIAENKPVCTIDVKKPTAFFRRIAAATDIGLAEAYMAGDIDADPDQLVACFNVFIANRDSKSLSSSSLVMSWLGAWVNRALHVMNANTVGNAQRNIAAHYDLSNELFATFLGDTWMYSCAMFDQPEMTLDQAQRRKVDKILELARIEPGMHVVEIGCGWGELAITAVKRYKCTVTAVTLSEQQFTLSRTRAKQAGVENEINFVKADYRVLSQICDPADRVISVEMVEAVGHEFLPAFFQSVDALLKPDGLLVLQVITTPEERYDVYRNTTDFIQKYIFPGGCCPSFEALITAASTGSRFTIESCNNIGQCYATTLREWRVRFTAAVKSGRIAELGFDKPWIRQWIYYLCYCEAGFATRTLGTIQMVMTRPSNIKALGGAPVAASCT